MGTHRTSLPGVGVQYDYTTESGQHISVVVHHDGRRFLGFYEKDDPDSCLLSVPLTTTEATGLAHLIDAAPIDAVRTEGIDLVTEHIPLGARSPYGGRLLVYGLESGSGDMILHVCPAADGTGSAELGVHAPQVLMNIGPWSVSSHAHTVIVAQNSHLAPVRRPPYAGRRRFHRIRALGEPAHARLPRRPISV